MNIDTIINALHAVREQKPLVVNITNYVVMNQRVAGHWCFPNHGALP
jgi:hydroxyethylthiazole kinase-like sugar kinase family protein